MTLQYHGRCLNVDDRKFCKDLKVFDGEVHDNWWRSEGHRIVVDDLSDVLSAKPDIIIIGTGYAGFMEISDALRSTLKSRNIEMIAEKTPEAVKAFNSLHPKPKKIAGAFHLTC